MTLITWKDRLTMILVTLLMIAIFSLIGYGVGRLVGNGKLFLILGVVLSYPFTQWFFLWRWKKKTSESSDKQ